MYFQKKVEIPKGRGVHDYGILRHEGECILEFLKARGGGG